MLIAYKYRIYPNEEQSNTIDLWIDECRKLYNKFLSDRREDYERVKQGVQEKAILNYYSQKRTLPLLKEEIPTLKTIHSQVLQDVALRLDKAFKGFFQRVKNKAKAGYPRFKGFGRYDSFMFGNSGYKLDSNTKRLKLSKIGEVKIKLHRELPKKSKIKTCTIKKSNGKYYAIFTLENELTSISTRDKKEIVGIDVGLTDYASMSDSTQINERNFKPLKVFKKSQSKLYKKLIVKQKELSRKKRGSKRRVKCKNELSNIHEKISNTRLDFIYVLDRLIYDITIKDYKLSHKLTDEYKIIVIEDLNIKEMVDKKRVAKGLNKKKSKSMRRNILNSAFGIFKELLTYKAERAGSEIIEVDARGTSQTCPNCNSKVPKTLKDRIHNCPYCGYTENRDIASAKVILNRGVGLTLHREIVRPTT